MRTLYHYPLCAFSRLVRIYLHEKAFEHELVIEHPWNRKKAVSERHMISDIPTLVEKDGTVLEGWYAIVEYLEQISRSRSFFGITQRDKAETRRITSLFNEMFFADVTKQIVFEKIIKKYTENKAPDSSSIRKGNFAVKQYMDYISWLSDRRNWLAGNDFTIADISAAAQISCVDYVGSIEWNEYPIAKDWYVRIKSRPSFRDILNDKISDIPPSFHYTELDF
jgi:glutathione S-transferase